MTESSQVWHVTREHLSPFGRLVRIENRLEIGFPDVYFCLRGQSGWIELKLLPLSGRVPDHFTREQLLWGRAEYEAGGRWYLLGKRGAHWVLYDYPKAEQWFKGQEARLFSVEGKFPTKLILDTIAPLKGK